MAMEKSKKYEDLLMDALGFDEDDLAANRAGVVTEAQIGVLHRMIRRQALGWIALIVIVLPYTLVLIPGLLALKNIDWICCCFTSPIVGGIILFTTFLRRMTIYMDDIYERRVKVAEGRVQLNVKAWRNAQYQLQVGDQRFPVNKKGLLTFKTGDPYRIYYAPHSKRILSAEWLRGDDNLLRD